jgi:hypothetical protein
MKSRTDIVRATPAVHEAYCRSRGLTTEGIRLGALKRVDCELGNLLDHPPEGLHPDHKEALEDLRWQVRIAIGDE